MKAIVQETYGSADVLGLRDMDRPNPGQGQVLAEVKSASPNIYDMHMTTGKPYMARAAAGWRAPKNKIPGADVAGVIQAVGPLEKTAEALRHLSEGHALGKLVIEV